MHIIELSPLELQDLLQKQTKLLLLDVRTQEERDFASIPGSCLYTQDLQAESVLWPKDLQIVCYCHHGVRSLAAAQSLRKQGFIHAYSLAGGIEEWSSLIDPSIPRY